MGGRRGLLLIPKGREGWGWHCFDAKLGKVNKFFEASVGVGAGNSTPAENSFGVPAGPRKGMGSKPTSEQRLFDGVGAPSCGNS